MRVVTWNVNALAPVVEHATTRFRTHVETEARARAGVERSAAASTSSTVSHSRTPRACPEGMCLSVEAQCLALLLGNRTDPECDACAPYGKSNPDDPLSVGLGGDIVCLQEAKLQERNLSATLARPADYESIWSLCEVNGMLGRHGVVTYASPSWSPVDAFTSDRLIESDQELSEADKRCTVWREGRMVVTDHGRFVLVNVYVPNAGMRDRVPVKLRFLRAVRRLLDRLVAAGRHVLLVGDVNVARSNMDVCRKFGDVRMRYDAEVMKFMDDWLGNDGDLDSAAAPYVDVWREMHPQAKDAFTVWEERTEARVRNEGARIDYCICNRGLLPHVKGCGINYGMPRKWSDHAPVWIELDFPDSGLSEKELQTPCALSSRAMTRFDPDRRQRKIISFFSAQDRDLDTQGEGVQTSISEDSKKPVVVNEVSQSRLQPPAKKPKGLKRESSLSKSRPKGIPAKGSIRTLFEARLGS